MLQKYTTRYSYSWVLLKRLVITDFKLRYQGSALGYLWSVLKPLAVFAVLYFVFVKFLRIGGDIEYYAIYLLVGVVLWNFFLELTTGATSAIVSKGDLIRKINFPKYVIVFATSFSALINLAINSVIIIIFMLIFGANPSWGAILVAPLAVLEVFILGMGIGMFLSALFVKFRDIAYIWEVIAQAGFFATPILYPIDERIPELAQKIIILNPLAQALQDLRHFVVTPQAIQIQNILNISYPRVITVSIVFIMFVIGALYFKKKAKGFAEEV